MSTLERTRSPVGRVIRSSFLWVIIAIILGIVTGNYVFEKIAGKPEIGLIKINSFLGPDTIPAIVKMIDYSEKTSSIKAVVLELDSPGGDSVSSEELYFRVTSLRSKKPVVTYVNTMAASGGYFTSMGSNFIIAKPSSMVGSVGAFTSLPPVEDIDQDFIWTGPYKRTQNSRKQATDQLESLKNMFLQIVVTERGDRLKITGEEISKAGIYSGSEAFSFGLVDQIGSGAEAFSKAAELAGLRNYSTVDIAERLEIMLRPWWFAQFGFLSLADNVTLENSGAPVFYYLYRPPELQP